MAGRRLPRDTEHAGDYVGLAGSYLGLWAQAVEMQARRILEAIELDDAASGNQEWHFRDGHAGVVDTAFFILALRNVESSSSRLVEALSFAGTPAAAADAAIACFRAAVPHLGALRHAFVHFEDYGFGTGNAQRAYDRPAPMRLEHKIENGQYVLRVHDAGQLLQIDVQKARDAARELGFEMLMAADWPDDEEQDDEE